MKTSILITVSALSLNLFLASAPSFAADSATAVDSATAPAPTSQTQDLKGQLKSDKAKLKSDIKANGKNSDVVKADRAQVKQDRNAIVSKKAKKHMRQPKSPNKSNEKSNETTAPGTGAGVTPPSS